MIYIPQILIPLLCEFRFDLVGSILRHTSHCSSLVVWDDSCGGLVTAAALQRGQKVERLARGRGNRVGLRMGKFCRAISLELATSWRVFIPGRAVVVRYDSGCGCHGVGHPRGGRRGVIVEDSTGRG